MNIPLYDGNVKFDSGIPWRMELLVLVLLMLMTSGGRDIRRPLDELLSFYRENREIISLLAGSVFGEHAPPPPPPEAQKSRPPEETGTDLIREFLKNRTL